MTQDGFRTIKRKVIAALQGGAYQHDTTKAQINTKNLLAMGDVTAETICNILKRSRGQDHTASPHHQVPAIMVHIIRREGWYIKFYFVDPATVFISVHQ